MIIKSVLWNIILIRTARIFICASLNSLINISRPIWKKPQTSRLPILKMILKN